VALSGSQPRRFVTCHGIDPEAISTPLLNVLRILPVTVLACGPGPQRILAEQGFDSTLLENATPPLVAGKSRAEFNSRFGVTDEDFVALWPARYSDQKNHFALLEFAESLRDTPIVVVCCGDGPLRSHFDDEVAQRELSKQIRTFDYVEQAGSWLGATDFFVMPSKWEGQPLILLEAMRADLPSLTWTPVGAELLAPSLRFPGPRDAADEVRRWLNDPTARLEAIAGFDSVVKGHELDIAVSRYIDLYYS
jgi:glycosyltransferase involved in cell wall biosynthesis